MAAGDSDEKRGGYRPRGGRPKGSKNARTKLREQLVEEIALRNQITSDVRALIPLGVRKKGLKALEEITIEEIEKDFKRRVGHSAHKLLNAQMSIALGTQSLYKVVQGVDEKGKPTRKHVLVTDDDEIRNYLDDPTMMNGEDYYYITTKQPDNNAINSALDRLFGKASTKVVGANNPDGSEGPIKVIVANFSPDRTLESPATQPIIETIVTDVIEESVADESPTPEITGNNEFDEIPAEYNVNSYGNPNPA